MTTDAIDSQRRRLGFLTIEETMALVGRGVAIADPHSTMVSPEVRFGADVVVWQNVTLQCRRGGTICIGAGTILFPGTWISADRGEIAIGDQSEIGAEGGFTIQVSGDDQRTVVGDGSRLLGGGSLSLSNDLGAGAQILGPIRAQNCRLGGGGSYRDPDPDSRGAVLKGGGVARDIDLPRGRVIQAFGLFAEAPVRNQSFFHPRP